MILVDCNLLLYAIDRSSPRHGPARSWLEGHLGGDEGVLLAMQTLLGFLRISTNPSVFDRPLLPGQSIDMIEGWLSRSNVAIARPTERHWRLLGELATNGQARGPQLMDAHLAALAIEHGATLMTTDRGFARFPRLRFRNPIA